MSVGSAGSPTEERVEPNASTGRLVGRHVTLRIANQTIRFRAEGACTELFLHDSHVPFRVQDDMLPDCDVQWMIEEVMPASVPVMRWFGQRWEIRPLTGGREEITFYNPVGNDPRLQPTMQMVSDTEFTSVQIRQAPRAGCRARAHVSEYPWAEYIVQRRLGLHGGAMIHASMAVWDGIAHLFLGHSGAGKSTIAELAEQIGATIPTDDRTIITAGSDGVIAWGTPWHGTFRRTSPDCARIGSISLIVQDSADRLDRIEAGRAAKEMFVRTVQTRVSEREVQKTLDTLESVVAQVPCFELRFRPTAAAVELVLRAAGQL